MRRTYAASQACHTKYGNSSTHMNLRPILAKQCAIAAETMCESTQPKESGRKDCRSACNSARKA